MTTNRIHPHHRDVAVASSLPRTQHGITERIDNRLVLLRKQALPLGLFPEISTAPLDSVSIAVSCLPSPADTPAESPQNMVWLTLPCPLVQQLSAQFPLPHTRSLHQKT